jgi:hypothetical protein
MYFITVLTSPDVEADIIFEKDCIGCFSEQGDVEDIIHRQAREIHDDVYDYLVIEQFSEGIYPDSENSKWYKYDSRIHDYVKTNEPSEFKEYVNFGINFM